jgi:GTP cyclohydrolase IA
MNKSIYSCTNKIVESILIAIGEDPKREGLLNTPERVSKSWDHLYSGYNVDIPSLFTMFVDGACSEMVVLRDIEFFSTCEHHMLPFFGKAHIGYIPDKKIIGVSKLARVLEAYSRRLQVQERICQQVTEAIVTNLNPLGAACILEAKHFCMVCRGVEKQNSVMVTSSMTGVFMDKIAARQEFLHMIRG